MVSSQPAFNASFAGRWETILMIAPAVEGI
jgi:hypothetical protein